MASFFYKPAGAWAADFIPFYHAGLYRLFYLLDWRDPAGHGEGTPWYQISTADLVHFTEHGQMLARGAPDEQDLYVFTGSVVEGEGRFHIFYTGHNPHFRRLGRPEQGVMHAVSNDLLRWHKAPSDTFFAPPEQYEPHDWRDPFVFWNQEAGEYWMLLAARLTTGPSRRRGCTAVCASKDLTRWEVREPLYAPGLYYTHECPDLFRIGDWWYLVFSEFSERCVTRYRMARSVRGPWLAPAEDTFDGRAFYAAKTASDGQRRFIFGWNPTREGETDTGSWQWGGNLVVHELVQQSDGTLRVDIPDSVDAAFTRDAPVSLQPGMGACRIEGRSVSLDAPHSFACATAGPLPETCKLAARLRFEQGTHSCGLMLRVDDALESAYYLRIEPYRQRLVLDRWPRPGDVPHLVELERPVALEAGRPIDLIVLVDGTVCEVYAGGVVAMSARLYDLKVGSWGVFVSEGVARFDHLTLHV